MSELLSPAGTLEAFYAAINNGCNAIYLGLDKFSARAYATNFNLENLEELVKFAHLRNVKIYVTINTIIYDYELNDVYKTIDRLAEINVDGIIVQDLAVLTYITDNYKSIHAHASTQMGIDDLDGAEFVKKLGVNRVVFARETKLETMKSIKEKLNIEVEAFIHGALCVSYSGNCLMSSMIGERSGNRGRCAGCCRKPYSLINLDDKKVITKSYLLSMKDLNTSNFIKDMSFVDSLKIEGRMKEPNYVASVTRLYREILDDKKINSNDFNKVFNRTYTKGFINGENSSQITNIEKPNNYGYQIGFVEKQIKNRVFIKLNSELNVGDQIRIETPSIFDEISLPITKMFDKENNQIETSKTDIIIYCDKNITPHSKVYKTKDSFFVKNAESTIQNYSYSKIGIDFIFNAKLGKHPLLILRCNDLEISSEHESIIESSISHPVTKDNIYKQLNKLSDTPYELSTLQINIDENIFISLKTINELRRECIEKLNIERLKFKVEKNTHSPLNVKVCAIISPKISVEVCTEEQYNAAKELGIENIYYKNIVRRNNAKYVENENEVLVGGLNGINHYLGKSKVVSDSSLNITNYKSVALLSSLGVERITLSNEINKDNINNLISNYFNEYKTYPNLELIVYGRTKIMHSKYCPLKRLGLCGECKKNRFALKDDFATFPILFNDDCTTTLLNSRKLNLIDKINEIKCVNYFRIIFTTEDKNEVKSIIKKLQEKINDPSKKVGFDPSTETHGHFIKNPL